MVFVDYRWMDLDIDTLTNMVLDSFDMQRGSVYGPCSDVITIGCYPIEEIEICLSDIIESNNIDLNLIKNDCESYISGCYAYETTDAVWYAVIDVESFNDNIQLHFDRGIV